jgi:Ca2+/H+ antiporter, TMEM165/GDT1 family
MPFDLKLFGTVFAVIFLAELPDKTALAALLLATRYRPLPVFLGAALALTIQSVVAVAAGGLVSLLPPRPVHIGAGVVLLIAAVVMWFRKSEEPTQTESDSDAKGKQSFVRAMTTTLGVVFIAEWGDLTQLGTAALAARYRSPLLVFSAANLALWAVTALAVLVGNRAGALLNPAVTKKVAAVVFLLTGAALIFGLL